MLTIIAAVEQERLCECTPIRRLSSRTMPAASTCAAALRSDTPKRDLRGLMSGSRCSSWADAGLSRTRHETQSRCGNQSVAQRRCRRSRAAGPRVTLTNRVCPAAGGRCD